jgi:hypothetical protein
MSVSTARIIRNGATVMREHRHNGGAAPVFVSSADMSGETLDSAVIGQGWQVAQLDGSGYRYLVRATGEFKRVGNVFAERVEIREVDTVAVTIPEDRRTGPLAGHTVSICSAPGERVYLSAWTAADNVTAA